MRTWVWVGTGKREVARPISRTDSHSLWTVLLHWTSVVAIIIAAASVLWREWSDDDALRALLMDVHRQSGNFVLVALGLRLVVRFGIGMGDPAGDMPLALRWAAQLAHGVMYAMLFALPILGLAASSAHATDVTLFGLLRLPRLASEDADLADRLTDYHLWTAWGLLFLVVLHVAAAWWHHVVRKDRVLVAMLPVIGRRRVRAG